MFEHQKPLLYVIIVLIALFIVCYLLLIKDDSKKIHRTDLPEPFGALGDSELDTFYELGSAGIENLTIDQLPCHESCCGDQWPVPFDGLNAEEIQQTIATMAASSISRDSDYVRTNLRCGNGPNGSGCPCVTKNAYLNLANRGQVVDSPGEIEKTLIL